MEKSKVAPQETGEQAVDLARKAMENYFQFFQKSLSVAPWAATDVTLKMSSYARQNVNATFDCAQRLVKAKDLREVLSIQNAFFQSQLRALTEQAKELGETAAKSASVNLREMPKLDTGQ